MARDGTGRGGGRAKGVGRTSEGNEGATWQQAQRAADIAKVLERQAAEREAREQS